jgi:hypothetical protein
VDLDTISLLDRMRRSLMFLGGDAPDVQPALLVLVAIALGGLVVAAARRKSPAI